MRSKEPATTSPRDSERLAQCALAADRSGGLTPCPGDRAFARFLEAEPGAPDQQVLLEHISTCDDCRRKWLSLSEALDSAEPWGQGSRSRKRRLMAAAGSACAVAVGVMLYLSIDYRPMVKTDLLPPETTESAADAQGTERFAIEAERAAMTTSAGDEAGNSVQAETKDVMSAAPPADAEAEADAAGMSAEKSLRREEQVMRSRSPAAAFEQQSRRTAAMALFAERFVACCGDYRKNSIEPETVEKLIEQGRVLLRSGFLSAEDRGLVEEMIDVLGALPSIDANRYEAVCDRAAAYGRRGGDDAGDANPQ